VAGDRDAISLRLTFEDPPIPAVDLAAANGSLRWPATRALLGRSFNFAPSGGKTPGPSQPRRSGTALRPPRMRPAFVPGPRRTGRKREPACPTWRRENYRHCGTRSQTSPGMNPGGSDLPLRLRRATGQGRPSILDILSGPFDRSTMGSCCWPHDGIARFTGDPGCACRTSVHRILRTRMAWDRGHVGVIGLGVPILGRSAPAARSRLARGAVQR